MGLSWKRVATRGVFVCLVVAVLLATAFVRRASARTELTGTMHGTQQRAVVARDRVTLGGTTRGFDQVVATSLRTEEGHVLAYPPSKHVKRAPLSVVYLHGVHGLAERGCPHVRNGATQLGWLVCPEAIEKDAAGMFSWGDDVFEQSAVVRRALAAAHAQGASKQPGVAVGFSQGSYVAVDLVSARLAKFSGLVLLGAEMHPNAKTLTDAGVKRIALGAGKADAAYGSMAEEAHRLDGEGIETRFYDLGNVGHTYAAEDTDALRSAIAWAGGEW
jgi:predicted esterase